MQEKTRLIVGDGSELKEGWYLIVREIPTRFKNQLNQQYGSIPVHISFDNLGNPIQSTNHPAGDLEQRRLNYENLPFLYPLKDPIEYANSLEESARTDFNTAKFIRIKQSELEQMAQELRAVAQEAAERVTLNQALRTPPNLTPDQLRNFVHGPQ